MDHMKNLGNQQLQRYANQHSLRLSKYQQEMFDYTMKLGSNSIREKKKSLTLNNH